MGFTTNSCQSGNLKKLFAICINWSILPGILPAINLMIDSFFGAIASVVIPNRQLYFSGHGFLVQWLLMNQSISLLQIMPKNLFVAIGLLISFFISIEALAQPVGPEQVKTGIYITSIHNIDFKQKEYAIDLWLWLRYKNRKFDFLQNLEIPQAKTVNKYFSTIDTSGDKVYLLMKLQCVMKDEWRIENFPFDRQNLRFAIENSQFDSQALVFVPDTFGKHFDERFTLRKWHIDSIKIASGIKVYETGFGDSTIQTPRSAYSTYKVRLVLTRAAMGLFWKMFLGMYLSFLIAFMCFYIHTDSIDSRFGLSVGALFAVVGNKYIIDSALPESTTFTLVDTLHGITLLFILLIMAANSYVLKLSKLEKSAKAERFDKVCAMVLMSSYLILNGFFIYKANH